MANIDTSGSEYPLMSNNKKRQLYWPDPLIIEPSGSHTATAILLHGRGSNAERFGLEFLKALTRSGKSLPELFPGLKFIFPTAKKRRSVVLKKIPINQWFDNYSLEDPSQRQDLQYDGLHETSLFVHKLIAQEIEVLHDARKVILGGLSQGCAASLHVLLNWQSSEDESSHLGGYFGMSGWLPFASDLDPRAEACKNSDDKDEDGEDDMFGSDNEEDTDTPREPESLQSIQRKAANVARDIASLTTLDVSTVPTFGSTPVFLGHGIHDEKVNVKLGEQARDVFLALGAEVMWKAYDEGHWYKVPDQIDDLVAFLNGVLN
ncbi:alpha/beta-hydrolase [Pseudovirgaria hyperparasitica]|uniref:Acyl-protein thioesterase 1 n=1 Tax=Pseudovirgaria hyperparasitica TaxID=470096 RepID=A0A6A6WME9_9PEZI|nr:alpha/beta-hydrolase [Pseudovirgaria hyperparasitica]KAF2763199.1 alpha/beta-hydrolase [Pseudovirgaria hyperparasitica]